MATTSSQALAEREPEVGSSAVLREHPWPPGYEDAPKLEFNYSAEVAAAVEQVWPLLSDVSRLNRALGSPEMKFEERSGLRHGKARYGGIMHEWLELPWDWVAGRWFRFLRVYSRGAMRALYAVHRLEALGPSRTRVSVYFGVVPRWRLLTPALRLSFGALGRTYVRTMPSLAQAAANGRPACYDIEAPPLREPAQRRLGAAAAQLRERGLDAKALDRLVDYVRRGDELELTRIQVRERARAWQLDESTLLRTCLHATRAGLLELAWEVVCPHCRGVRSSEKTLAGLKAEAACDVCAVTFGTSDAVEVSFRVHPAIREVTPRLYCSAEPATKAHIRVQRLLAPGSESHVQLALAPGRYRLRRRGVRSIEGFLEVAGDAPASELAWRASAPPGEQRQPTTVSLRLINDAAGDETFVVEDAQPSDLALRPASLLSHPEFRDLFSDELLADGVGLAVGEQTILFTDIVGSTAMYAERGDPGAFVAVRQHFDEVFKIIETHRGAVIKTIGDAVMAAFTDPLDGLRAAEALQRAFSGEAPLRLRVSINTGPCIAVRLNANLDYFGHTVNVAAKLQAVAEAGQVALSPTTLAALGVSAHLDQAGAALERADITVKGLATPLASRRWSVW